MSISNMQQANPSSLGQAWRGLWHAPSLTIARFTLASYIRSGWILGDIVLVWLLYAAFFYEFGGNVTYFYGSAAEGLAALAILGPVVMVQRAMSARVYLPLARLTSRSAYVRGLIIATGVLRIPLFLMLLVLAILYHGHSNTLCTPMCIEGATLSNMLVGAIGLLANSILISTLTVAFSAPLATRKARIVLLAWFVLVLYSNTSPDAVATTLGVTRIPLIPFTLCYNFGINGTIGWSGLLALLIVAVYVAGLILLAQYWMARRDLLLQ